MTYEELVRFHGHSCPGLAIGYRMTLAALAQLRTLRAEEEELVAIVENDACGVDALQCLAGCTFGKGNLRFRDYGKHVYTLYSRASGAGVRVLFHGRAVPEEVRQDKARLASFILAAPQESIITVSAAARLPPEPAKIRQSVLCSSCGEPVMDSRTRMIEGRIVCLPCAEAAEVR
ncbi:MAG: formylmethanofuran dehydrogenase [Desulfobulbus sp.]|nr:MAG: formylmethanofuran dehydrogenase [Desulfobulbus sp.]